MPMQYTKQSCRIRFQGSDRLFNACWRDLLFYRRHTEIDNQDDADRWLDELASHKVNNPRSSFWLKG